MKRRRRSSRSSSSSSRSSEVVSDFCVRKDPSAANKFAAEPEVERVWLRAAVLSPTAGPGSDREGEEFHVEEFVSAPREEDEIFIC